MKMAGRPDHHALADALWRRVLEGPGEIDPALQPDETKVLATCEVPESLGRSLRSRESRSPRTPEG
jgi:hypothetical protein